MLLCLLIDGRHPEMPIDKVAYDWLIEAGVPLQIVVTKADKLTAKEKSANLAKIKEMYPTNTPPILYSLSLIHILKQRVASDEGHLSNEMAAQALLMMKRPDFMQVILAHRSENNNNAVLVTQTIGKMLVDGGVRIGPEMKLQHGQPNEIVSMQSIKR